MESGGLAGLGFGKAEGGLLSLPGTQPAVDVALSTEAVDGLAQGSLWGPERKFWLDLLGETRLVVLAQSS